MHFKGLPLGSQNFQAQDSPKVSGHALDGGGLEVDL